MAVCATGIEGAERQWAGRTGIWLSPFPPSLPDPPKILTLARMRNLPHTRSCFVCGESNSIGLKLVMETDDRIVQVRFTPRAEHVGFKGVVHGGIIATLLDELMVWACAVGTNQFSYCAEFTTRFLKPLRPGETALAQAELTANRRNRIFEARATLQSEEKVELAYAVGKYIPLKPDEGMDMASDFVGQIPWVLSGSSGQSGVAAD